MTELRTTQMVISFDSSNKMSKSKTENTFL